TMSCLILSILLRLPPSSTLFPYTTLFRSVLLGHAPRRPSTYRPVSRFPSADIDLAFVVEDTIPAGDVECAIHGGASDLIEGVERSEEHTSELQSRGHLVCRLLLEKKKYQH